MSELAEKLSSLAMQLEKVVRESMSSKFAEPLNKLREATDECDRSWSKSFLGYHSCVYYENFEPPPPGAHFSILDGLSGRFSSKTCGEWREYAFDDVRNAIFAAAKMTSLDEIEKISKHAKDIFENAKEEFFSIATISLENKSDAVLSRLKNQAEELKVISKFEFNKAVQPKGQFRTLDMLAAGQGLRTPPHIAIVTEVCALKNPAERCDQLAKIIRRAATHLETREHHQIKKRHIGTNVFLGHGRSLIWRELKDFIEDRLDLSVDEFNRVPVAGITNIARLSQMLDDAAIAFIILTAEDEQMDAKMHPRMNAVHEAGLFQGKLGFTKAIILLEEGCEEFSNIHGLGQIRFPKGNIKSAFEEIRAVLERETLISD